jgi:hypothetical protein
MNLDAVRLEVCFSVPPTPTFTPLPATPTPIPIVTSDAVERTLPADMLTDEAVRSLAIGTPTAEPPLEVIEEAGGDLAAILSALGGFLLRNWEWVLGLLGIGWLIWRFVLR